MTKCPIETIRDLVLARIPPSDNEIYDALRETGASRAVKMAGRWKTPITNTQARRLIAGLLQPQVEAISANMLVKIPHLGKVN